MNQDEIDALNGRVAALTMALSSIIQTLPALSAAQAAVALKTEQLDQPQYDEEYGTSQKEVAARDAIVDSYLQLLSAAASR